MTEKTCTCGAQHSGHLCILKSKGMTHEIEALSANPAYVCFNCGAEAASSDNLCSPVPIAPQNG